MLVAFIATLFLSKTFRDGHGRTPVPTGMPAGSL